MGSKMAHACSCFEGGPPGARGDAPSTLTNRKYVLK